jgi:DNA-binding Lrp family transcriptional regulator
VRQVFKGTDPLSALDVETFPVSNERFQKWQSVGSPEVTTEEAGMIRRLQELFPLTDEPYRMIGADLGITEAQVLERMKALVSKGCLKRIGSFLKPAVVVPEARTLVVWQIPEEKLERIGSELAGFSEVRYADRRPACQEFPYALYTMIQTGTPEELEVVTRRIQDRIGKWPCRVVTTIREFKKEPVRYFPKGLDAWWRENRHAAETEFNGST